MTITVNPLSEDSKDNKHEKKETSCDIPAAQVVSRYDHNAKAPSLQEYRRRRILILVILFAVFLLMVSFGTLLSLMTQRHRPLVRNVDHVFRRRFSAILLGHRQRLIELIDVNNAREMVFIPKYEKFRTTKMLHNFMQNYTVIHQVDHCVIKPMRMRVRSYDISPNVKIRFATPVNEHWHLVRPALKEEEVYLKYGILVAQFCYGLPVYRLESKSDFLIRDNWVERAIPRDICPKLKCRACPKGEAQRLDRYGCMTSCECFEVPFPSDKSVLCPDLSVNNCPKKCRRGWAKEPVHGCDICECYNGGFGSQVFRGKRSLPTFKELLDKDDCPVRESLLEGFMLGDDAGLVPILHIHDCKK